MKYTFCGASLLARITNDARMIDPYKEFINTLNQENKYCASVTYTSAFDAMPLLLPILQEDGRIFESVVEPHDDVTIKLSREAINNCHNFNAQDLINTIPHSDSCSDRIKPRYSLELF